MTEQLISLFLSLMRHFPDHIDRQRPQSKQFIETQKERHPVKLKACIENENDPPEQGQFPQ